MSEKIEKTIKRLNKLIKAGNSAKALKTGNKFLKKYPDNLDFVLIKSKILFNLEKYEELYEFLNRYDEDIYENLELVKLKTKLLQHFQLMDEIVKFVNKSLIYYPDDLELRNINIDTVGNYVEIEDEALLQEIVKVNPNNSEGYISLAYVYINYGREDCSKYDQAIGYFDRAIELQKSDPYYDNEPTWLYIDKGDALIESKKYQEAISTFDLIPDEDINAEIKIRQKAIIYRKIGDYDKALKLIDLAIEKDEDDDSYLKEIKGTIYLCMEDYDSAIEYFNQSSAKGWDASYYIALALKGKKEYDKAIEFLNKIKHNEYLLKNGKTDFEYEKAQKLIKTINDLI
ncbi:tetratricopeptide repeat protein [Methanobrevibacter curvatus]|uniref:Anaphase-promoting complex, cyclosome, subunit 3 n=1 Tax=Methanobrevibacter curvatus TaxID=49547 RepID=A0A166D0V9_9EURY|nr:tetratricopeptide repeat protein [Methanobrevibacter curvatus]KZX15084.1 anaphase-promoting complex, cyclosome, subunit 3 [Methanobrevibacter curvatus]